MQAPAGTSRHPVQAGAGDMAHNTLIVADPPTGGWRAWCRPCGWEGPAQQFAWAARLDKDTHEEGPR